MTSLHCRDPATAKHAARFIRTFNLLLGERGPDGAYFVEEIRDDSQWTTQRYRSELIDRAVQAGRFDFEELFDWKIGLDRFATAVQLRAI